MTLAFDIAFFINAPAQQIYEAWLGSEGHTQMTGSPAVASDGLGETFSAWDGYIAGSNLALESGVRIVQSWRTLGFVVDAPDSRIEVRFEAEQGGTRLTIRHTDLPDDGAQYASGWVTHYLVPMTEHFSTRDQPSET